MVISKCFPGVIFFASIMIGCGLFEPRDSELPAPVPQLDIFKFGDIIRPNGQKFFKLNYKSIFTDTFTYDDGINSYYKQNIEERLDIITSEYDSVYLEWDLDSLIGKGSLDKNKINTVYRIYKIQLFSSIDSLLALPDSNKTFTGGSYFNIVYDEIRGWLITRWRDMPTGGPQRSFFHPDFESSNM